MSNKKFFVLLAVVVLAAVAIGGAMIWQTQKSSAQGEMIPLNIRMVGGKALQAGSTATSIPLPTPTLASTVAPTDVPTQAVPAATDTPAPTETPAPTVEPTVAATVPVTATLPIAATIAAMNPISQTAVITTANTVNFEDEITWPRDKFTFEITNVRDVIPLEEVDYARGGFTATWPFLGNLLGEPGKLNVSSDFPQDVIDSSGGAIQRTDPLNQYRLTNNDYTNVGCNEGAMAMVALQYAFFEFENGVTIAFRVPDGANAHVYFRCPSLNPAAGQDDNNLGNIRVSGYRAGYGEVTHFSGIPGGGFVSEGGAMQALQISQTGHTSGSTGATETYVITLNPFAGDYSVAVWDGTQMKLLQSNWWTPSSTP